ncbi:MAG: hypothetical protein CMD96_04830 [Gammaproteobacteria bacterium]|jgi:uncharacterized tellurite resistance protein B-like protein|nr:hypothetical protein [Gammaproteobacteria bacterium]MBQ09094.1 hypothetical protein [Gammaproteobacteria bacterium]|tara:strand:- start:5431 stop:5955 length:525 start_codon:yes stop_codon:yes gene_type:complete
MYDFIDLTVHNHDLFIYHRNIDHFEKKVSDFFKFFKPDLPQTQTQENINPVEMAATVLMIEMARADFEQDDLENQTIIELLQEYFGINIDDANKLFHQAEKIADDSVSLHEFTRTLHETLDPEAKNEIIEMLWRLALVDDSLDRYEDYLVRKIADLLYVSNSIVLRIKHDLTSN